MQGIQGQKDQGVGLPLPIDEKKLRIIEKATALDRKMLHPKQRRVPTSLRLQRHFLRYYFTRPPRWRVLLRAKMNRPRMQPAFASLGPVRSGTTQLADYIMQHPCVVLPLAKEIGVSTRPTWKLIRAQFPSLREKERIERKYGTAITGYCAPVVPSLLFACSAWELNEQLKVVLILRNPVERTFSHWRWDRGLAARFPDNPFSQAVPDFSELVRMELEALESKATSGFCVFSGADCGGYVQHSIYLPFLKVLLRSVDRSRVMIINADRFFADPQDTARKVYRFLGLPDYEPVAPPSKNSGPPGKMEESTRGLLCEFFEPLNQDLYALVGEDFAWH